MRTDIWKPEEVKFLLESQLEDARKQITAERETRLAVAQAESVRQGVVVNTGK